MLLYHNLDNFGHIISANRLILGRPNLARSQSKTTIEVNLLLSLHEWWPLSAVYESRTRTPQTAAIVQTTDHRWITILCLLFPDTNLSMNMEGRMFHRRLDFNIPSMNCIWMPANGLHRNTSIRLLNSLRPTLIFYSRRNSLV